MKNIIKFIIIFLLINEIIGFEFKNLNSIILNNNINNNIDDNNNIDNNNFKKIQCSDSSLYPYDLPVLIYIVSLIESSSNEINLELYNDSIFEITNKLLTASVNGRTCLSEGNNNNLIFQLSFGSNVTIPQQLIEKEFDAKYININFRGEILSFPNLSILIKYNNISDTYHIETIFKKYKIIK
ncbi:hypothetical protein RB653_000061 [Dictyostelium firmibasis]|uniref:Uncharacterized protein n=1 Tax=Dictyostelium firmibasis TaxID=79012 RepID=A0AAN7U5H4_9MYCE